MRRDRQRLFRMCMASTALLASIASGCCELACGAARGRFVAICEEDCGPDLLCVSLCTEEANAQARRCEHECLQASALDLPCAAESAFTQGAACE